MKLIKPKPLDLERMEKEVPDYVGKPEDIDGISAAMVVLVKDIADKLEKDYPGWLWAVQPFEDGGIIKIYSLHCSGNFGYIIKTSQIQSDPHRKLAREAGGEILERYGLPRGPYRRDLISHKPRDILGNLIPDLTDKDQRTQKRERDRVIDQAVADGKIQFKTVDKQSGDGTVHRELYMQISGDDDA